MGLFRKKKLGLTREQLQWNAIWQLWAEEKARSPYAELMTYQSEMDNGGHEQYFDHVIEFGNLPYELSVLDQVLPVKLRKNLTKAHHAYLVLQKNEDDEKAEDTLEHCDDVFFENEEQIDTILKRYADEIRL
jgi:hypothetical protein